MMNYSASQQFGQVKGGSVTGYASPTSGILRLTTTVTAQGSMLSPPPQAPYANSSYHLDSHGPSLRFQRVRGKRPLAREHSLNDNSVTDIETTSGDDWTYFAVPEDEHHHELALSSRFGRKKPKPAATEFHYDSEALQ